MNENQQLRSEPWKVWSWNVEEEMNRFKKCLKNYPLIAFDTEYPGTIHRTFPDSSDIEWYFALKSNVESTKLIQCGFTLFNSKGEIGGTWEFNFSNFGDPSDTRNEVSIEFLTRHGLDLQKIRKDGVDMFGYGFFPKLLSAFRSRKHVQFVTFQGAYDFAYFISVLNNGKLPETHGEFALEVVKVFGEVYDVKVMAGFCEGLSEHLGLSKLAQILNISRVGRAHHAGSDSLLTAFVFIKMYQLYDDSKFARGMLYGIGKRKMVTTVSRAVMCQENVVSYPSIYHSGYMPSYEHTPPIYYVDHSGVPYYPPLMQYNHGMFVNQLNHPLPSSTSQYQSQTPYAAAADYNFALHPNLYNNNPCFVKE